MKNKRYQVRLKRTGGIWGRVLQAIRFGVFLLVALALMSLAAAGGLFLYYLQGLPSPREIADYKPYVVSRVYDRNGTIIGEIKRENERRVLVSIDELPEHVVWAFVSAEDKNFFEHQGLDFTGIFRAFVKNLIAGQIVEGGSTITQQVVKSIALSPKRTIERKIKEAIIAQRIERHIPKRKILELYLNQIYFGHGAYGIEVASETFFGKRASDLTVSEAALLAGLPRAPLKYSPYRHPEAAERRRKYVLYRMREDGHLTDDQLAKAISERPEIRPLSESTPKIKAPYFFELVVRQLFELFGEDVVYRAGWDIRTTLDLDLQQAARRALQEGLREYSKRHGFKGAVESVPQIAWRRYRSDLASTNGSLRTRYGIEKALIVEVNDRKRLLVVDTGAQQGIVPYKHFRWAFSMRTEDGGIRRVPHIPSRVFKRGDVVWVRRVGSAGGKSIFSLEQMPDVQGAVVVIDPGTREVLALVGGYDYYDSPFNRAGQAQRQPGSAFKPIVYSAALNAGFTPASVFVDTALIFDDG
ncbi:MAG TPA: penicillin-binding protein, partial [Proteobacteria bacterium]|nr:penicillin-binding protein [Pseudomonadota bacterium]